ncbi:hypothetical protein HDU97_010250 [Phlyctochytrium planicorne]|nr:hypothetical protein HDU97_010250 [Phlyctochytrium planicorne]
MLPVEVMNMILLASSDWRISLKLEAIRPQLPRFYPNMTTALATIDLPSTFPASSVLLKRFLSILPYGIHLTLLLPFQREIAKGVNLTQPLTLLESALVLHLEKRNHHIVELLNGNRDSIKILRYAHKHLDREGGFAFLVRCCGLFDTVFGVAVGKGCLIGDAGGDEERRIDCSCWDTVLPTISPCWNSHLDVVNYLVQCLGSTFMVQKACEHGHLSLLIYLIETLHSACTPTAVQLAASNNHTPILRYLHHSPSSTHCWSQLVVNAAAMNGHLDAIMFLHDHRGRFFTANALDIAIGAGKIDVVRFLNENREEGCKSRSILEAALAGHLEVVTYVLEHREELHDFACEAIAYAMSMERLEVVRWLVEDWQAIQKDGGYFRACEKGYVGLVDYLFEAAGMDAEMGVFEMRAGSNVKRYLDDVECALRLTMVSP